MEHFRQTCHTFIWAARLTRHRPDDPAAAAAAAACTVERSAMYTVNNIYTILDFHYHRTTVQHLTPSLCPRNGPSNSNVVYHGTNAAAFRFPIPCAVPHIDRNRTTRRCQRRRRCQQRCVPSISCQMKMSKYQK